MRGDAERLRDLLDAAERSADRLSIGRAKFDADEDRQLAVVRLLEIVEEACVRRSADLQRRHAVVPCRAAANLRNRVIHGYFDIGLVWSAATDEVPDLARAARVALDELSTEEGEG